MASFRDRLAVTLGSGLYTGYFPIASGTVGTVVAVPLYILIAKLPLPWYLAVVALVSVVGIWAAGRCADFFGEMDSPKVVIDEIAGYLLTMAALPIGWGWMTAGFFAFRLFDILKPPPARWIDHHLHTGLGVVLDDLVAGLYGVALLQGWRLWKG